MIDILVLHLQQSKPGIEIPLCLQNNAMIPSNINNNINIVPDVTITIIVSVDSKGLDLPACVNTLQKITTQSL